MGTLSKGAMPARHGSLEPKIDSQSERDREVEEGKIGKRVRFSLVEPQRRGVCEESANCFKIMLVCISIRPIPETSI